MGPKSHGPNARIAVSHSLILAVARRSRHAHIPLKNSSVTWSVPCLPLVHSHTGRAASRRRRRPPRCACRSCDLPGQGSDRTQQQQDKTECYSWATKQTGYDPVQVLQQQQAQQTAQTQQAQAAAAAPPPQGQVAGGAARGAAGGALIGAAAGDAGKGAAIGATVGAVGGSAKKRRQADAQAQAQQQQAAQQAQQNAANNAKLADYQKNFGACMQGRGYGVS